MIDRITGKVAVSKSTRQLYFLFNDQAKILNLEEVVRNI